MRCTRLGVRTVWLGVAHGGRTHHVVMSTALAAEDPWDLAKMTGTELALIDTDTTTRRFSRASLEQGLLSALSQGCEERAVFAYPRRREGDMR